MARNLSKKDKTEFTNILINNVLNNIGKIIMSEDEYLDRNNIDTDILRTPSHYTSLYSYICGVCREVIRDLSGSKETIFLSDYIPILRSIYVKLAYMDDDMDDGNLHISGLIYDHVCDDNLTEKFKYSGGRYYLYQYKINNALMCAYVESLNEFCESSSYKKYKDWMMRFNSRLDFIRNKYMQPSTDGFDYVDWTVIYVPAIAVCAGLTDTGYDRKDLLSVLFKSMTDHVKLSNAFNEYILNLKKCEDATEDLKLPDYLYIVSNFIKLSEDYNDIRKKYQDDEDIIDDQYEELDENDTLDISQIQKENQTEENPEDEFDLDDDMSDGEPYDIGEDMSEYITEDPETPSGEDYAEGCQDDINEKDDDKVDLDKILAEKTASDDSYIYDMKKEREALATITKKVRNKEIKRVKELTRSYLVGGKYKEKFNSPIESNLEYKMIVSYHNIMMTSVYDLKGHHSIKLDNLSEKQYKAVIKSIISIIKKGIQ